MDRGSGGAHAHGGGGGGTSVECPEGCEANEGACGMGMVTWACFTGPFDFKPFRDAGCMDLATQVPRFCCPPSFLPECQ
jgi:hypothetical protein